MIRSFSLIAILTLGVSACQPHSGNRNSGPPSVKTVYESESLIIRQLAEHTYQHISWLETDDFGKVSCNGMIVTGGNEAVIFDTPADEESSGELIRFFTQRKNLAVKALVATHFHADCVAGLDIFHRKGIPSYASNATIALLQTGNRIPATADETASQNTTDLQNIVPRHGFSDNLILTVGSQPVFAGFFGEGHTPDNIVAYFPADQVLFGGCLIKEEGAGKGNLEDANEAAWPRTVEAIKKKYPGATIVIPGHGKTGDAGLLDYTIGLFGG